MEPRWEDTEETAMTMVEREARKAEWNGKLTVHADCMAVIHAVRRPGAALRDQFKYGLCYKHAGYGAFGKVLKVDAHKGKDQANAEGWGDQQQRGRRGCQAGETQANREREAAECRGSQLEV